VCYRKTLLFRCDQDLSIWLPFLCPCSTSHGPETLSWVVNRRGRHHLSQAQHALNHQPHTALDIYPPLRALCGCHRLRSTTSRLIYTLKFQFRRCAFNNRIPKYQVTNNSKHLAHECRARFIRCGPQRQSISHHNAIKFEFHLLAEYDFPQQARNNNQQNEHIFDDCGKHCYKWHSH
jgi:hypothetical protein